MLSLELASFDELLTELMKRCDHAVFAGMLLDAPPGQEVGRIDEHRRIVGNTRTCQGLAFGVMEYAQALHDQRASKNCDEQGNGV